MRGWRDGVDGDAEGPLRDVKHVHIRLPSVRGGAQVSIGSADITINVFKTLLSHGRIASGTGGLRRRSSACEITSNLVDTGIPYSSSLECRSGESVRQDRLVLRRCVCDRAMARAFLCGVLHISLPGEEGTMSFVHQLSFDGFCRPRKLLGIHSCVRLV